MMNFLLKMAYKGKYKHIKRETIDAVKRILLEQKYYRQQDDDKFLLLKTLLQKLNQIYGTNTRLKRTKEDTAGYYSPAEKSIYMNKLSMVTFLHEYKHSLQHQKGKENNEAVARGWSVSLFATASSRHYQKAVEKGILFYH